MSPPRSVSLPYVATGITVAILAQAMWISLDSQEVSFASPHSSVRADATSPRVVEGTGDHVASKPEVFGKVVDRKVCGEITTPSLFRYKQLLAVSRPKPPSTAVPDVGFRAAFRRLPPAVRVGLVEHGIDGPGLLKGFPRRPLELLGLGTARPDETKFDGKIGSLDDEDITVASGFALRRRPGDSAHALRLGLRCEVARLPVSSTSHRDRSKYVE